MKFHLLSRASVIIAFVVTLAKCAEREEEDIISPYRDKAYAKWILQTPIDPFYLIEAEPFGNFLIREQEFQQYNEIRKAMEFKEQSKKASVDEHQTEDIRTYVKHGARDHEETVADWFFYYKNTLLTLTAACTLLIPVIIAGLVQLCINCCRANKPKIDRKSWEFPIVPVLYLQQTRREYMLRKKTLQRFCIQWEVGRINIRMNTKLVDLKQVLHPPQKQKKRHRYTTWKILKLIVRFNAVLAMKKRKIAQNEQPHLTEKEKEQKWRHRIESSRYMKARSRVSREGREAKSLGSGGN